MSNNKNYIEELEDAALEIAQMETPDGAKYTSFPLYVAFKSGAKWMRKRMMMMMEAVEYEVGLHGEPIEITLDKYVQRAKGIFPGDKIKIILVKED